METITKKTITSLTSDSVSILTQQFEYGKNGEEVRVGENHRCAYENSESGRALLIANEPEEVVEEVFAIWGDTPILEEPNFSDYVPEPTTDDIINALLGV